jgi:hypothetical protein
MNKSSVLSQIIEACLSVVILYINVLLFGCPYVPTVSYSTLILQALFGTISLYFVGISSEVKSMSRQPDYFLANNKEP